MKLPIMHAYDFKVIDKLTGEVTNKGRAFAANEDDCFKVVLEQCSDLGVTRFSHYVKILSLPVY